MQIVLIHGLSIPAIVWKDVAPVLAARGFRVLLYGTYLLMATGYLNFNLLIIYPKDLYGRGYSEAPQTTYDTNLYTAQLAHLMQYIRWEKANIVGISMVCSCTHFLANDLSRFQGGAIAAAFTSHFPHLVDEGVALIASTGLVEVRISSLLL